MGFLCSFELLFKQKSVGFDIIVKKFCTSILLL